VVPATVDTASFDPSLELAADLDVPSDGPVIGTIANVNKIKGLETLIRAAARLRELGHALHVVIVGATPEHQRGYQRRLKSLADELGLDRLYFIGARSDVRPVLKQLDVYCCCSVAESSPVSVWEAMAMSRPVVSTDVGDVARHVRDGEAGFIVPVGDDAAMADRIARLLDDPEAAAQMGVRAREAAKVFDPQEIASLTLGIYERVCGFRPLHGARKKAL
jgi:glycosyltransferase involved in cell wall biosynthesis